MPSDKKMIFTFHQKNKGGNRDYCRHFSVIPETTSKFFFLRLLLENAGADGVTAPRREIDIRYESDLNVVLKCLGCK